MKKLNLRVGLLTILMVGSWSVNGMNDNKNHSELQKVSWFSWFKSYIPGTNEYNSRKNNILPKRLYYEDGTLNRGREYLSYKNGVFSTGQSYSQDQIRFNVECYGLLDGGYLFNAETGQRKNVNFTTAVSRWKNNLIKLLETWEENSEQEHVSGESIQLSMCNNVREVIETIIKGDIVNLTPVEKKFLINVGNDLCDRIMGK